MPETFQRSGRRRVNAAQTVRPLRETRWRRRGVICPQLFGFEDTATTAEE